MEVSSKAKNYYLKMFGEIDEDFIRYDSEFAEIFANFAFDEVVNSDYIGDETRFIAILSALLGAGNLEVFRIMIPAALNFGLTPIKIKEIIYQGVPYLGIGHVYPFIKACNKIFSDLKIDTPPATQSNVTKSTRLKMGAKMQVQIFGSDMADFYKAGRTETRHLNEWITANCFGDFYTRDGLNLKEREMVTFCLLLAFGDCGAELNDHIKGNIRLGNDRGFLIRILSQIIPYIGYPRAINALGILNKVAAK